MKLLVDYDAALFVDFGADCFQTQARDKNNGGFRAGGGCVSQRTESFKV